MSDTPKYKRCLRYRAATSTTSSDPHLDQLIEEVKKYPCLYNSNSLQYRDQYRKEECWDIISRIMHSSRGDLKKEWKRLRDGYRQALVTRSSGKKEAKKKVLKPWKYEEQMDFLKPYICPRSRLLVASRSASSDNEFYYFPIKEEAISDEDSSHHSASEQPRIVSEFLIRKTLKSMKPDPDAPSTPKMDGKKRKKKICCMPRKRAASACASKPPGDDGGEGSSTMPQAGYAGTPLIDNNHGENGNGPSSRNSGDSGFSPGETSTQPAAGCSNNSEAGPSSGNLFSRGNTSSAIDLIDITAAEIITKLDKMFNGCDKVMGPSNNNPNNNGTVPSTSKSGSTLSSSNIGHTPSISDVRKNDSTSSTSNADNNDGVSSFSSYDNNGTPLSSDGENNDTAPSPIINGSVPFSFNTGNNGGTTSNNNGSTSSLRNNVSVPSTSNAGSSGVTPSTSNNGDTPSNSNAGSTSSLRNARNNGSTSSLRNARNNASTPSSSSAGNNGRRPLSGDGGNNRVSTSSNRAGTRGVSTFVRNFGNYALERYVTRNLSSDSSYVVFVNHDPNNPENNDHDPNELPSSSRLRTYNIQDIRPESLSTNRSEDNGMNRIIAMSDATPSTLRSSDQVYRAIQPGAGALEHPVRNNEQQLSSIQLFLASIYQTIKQMPLKYQNNIKINILEYLKVAEEEFEQIKAQRANNDNDVPEPSQSNQENRGSMQLPVRFLGDNDLRHGALQLYLASIYESLRNMPSHLISFMKINMLELVNNVEEIYRGSQ